MNSITLGIKLDKTENTDYEANGTCFKPWFWIHNGPRTSCGH